MHNQELITELQKQLSIELHGKLHEDELQLLVQQWVNELIEHDFQRLLHILYRTDVSEQKLKQLLQASDGENAAAIIASLIIERQVEKIKSRRHFKNPDNDNSTEEKW